ncbi:MAG: YolD-like family protein [Muribaculaceae bacterium]|nr:YolD-like family protein [Muribaculaceae bacterium]
MGKYDDIINMPHHVSDYHKPLPMANRAAQFAPFAALSGHDDAIAETVRLTESFKEPTDDEKLLISRKILFAMKNDSQIRITYFIPDKIKEGGSYKMIQGFIKKWDEFDKHLILKEGTIIPVDFICDIEIREGNGEF